MSEKMQETIADIVEAMKRRKEMLEDAAFNAPLCYSTETMKAQCEILDELIERFEAAHGRELSKNASKNGADFGQLGDAAKLREAMKRIVAASIVAKDANAPEWILQRMADIFAMATTALAAPPRNCDVGTAEEQIERWKKFCMEHHEYWKPSKSLTAIQRCNCPCHEGNGCNHFIWAQMPYERGGAK